MKFHYSALNLIRGKDYKQARKTLRELGCTHSEQDQVIRAYKDYYKINCLNKESRLLQKHE